MSDRDEARDRETLHPTGTVHAIPDFVGSDDDDIDGAPPWAIAIARRDRAERREVIDALREERKLLHRIDLQQARILANQELQKKDLQNFRREARERLTSHEGELEQLREASEDHEVRLTKLEAR